MDISSWTEMESIFTNDHAFVNHCQMMTQFIDDESAFSSSWKENHQKMTSFSSCISFSISNSDSNSLLLAASTLSKNYHQNLNMASVKTEVMPSSETTINFSSHDFEDDQRLIQSLGYGNNNNIEKKSYSRSGLQAQEHVLAERNRRERLTQRFITLSTLIPNLKKLDKATVLADAIKYINQLKEQVKKLEEIYSEEKSTVAVKRDSEEEESTVAVKRARVISNNIDSSSIRSENSNIISTDKQSLPEIEVRASNGNVLIRICCKNQNRIIKEIFSQVEKLNLSIISSSVMPFGCNTSYITIIAQMDHQLSKATEDDDVNRIRGVIMKLINGQDEAEV